MTPCVILIFLVLFCNRLNNFDAEEDTFVEISWNYRGEVKSKEANAIVQWLQNNKKCTFVEWWPTGFKVWLNEISPALVQDDDMGERIRNVTIIGNNICISRVFIVLVTQDHLHIGVLVSILRKEFFECVSWKKYYLDEEDGDDY